MDVQVRKLDCFLGPMVLMGNLEEEKKALIGMLGKLYITANSKSEKLQSTTELVVEAVDNKIAQDAPSRNALNKLHSAMNKALGEAGKSKPMQEDTLGPVGRDDGLTAVDEQVVEEYSMAHDGDIRMEGVKDGGASEVQDSLLEELLHDDEDDDL